MKLRSKSQALNKIFHYLKYRLRSEKEIRAHFKGKIESLLLEELIAQLKGQGFIDDLRFAHLWAEEKLRKGYGKIYIFYELLKKGIDKSLIREVLDNINKSSQEDIARSIVSKKIKEREPAERKRKIYALLKRRGFEDKVISTIIEREDCRDY